MTDNCTQCGRWTDEGRQKLAERSRNNPIYGTNLQRPKSEIIQEFRDGMAALRGGISDFQSAFPEWKERTQHVEGLLTCGIGALYNAVQELEKFERASLRPNV